jgi:hypothetical protein
MRTPNSCADDNSVSEQVPLASYFKDIVMLYQQQRLPKEMRLRSLGAVRNIIGVAK